MKAKEAMRSVSVRFPATLYRRLKAKAKGERRSFNGQVVKILDDATTARVQRPV